jgi:DNA-binding HxlR family transcriptional regulator
MKEKLLLTDVLKALSDEYSLSLFNAICTSSTDSEKLMASYALSKRQYYDRMNDLRNSGLIRRQKGKYETTSFGHIIFSTLKIAEKATERHWKLQALDMMNLSANRDSQGVDHLKIIDVLLDDIEIKEILLRKTFPVDVSKEQYGLAKPRELVRQIR